jgi:NAD+ synthase (glutamine-hydrolysing)
MKVAVAQIDPVVGSFEANVKKIKEAYQRACTKRARLLLTPELALCGYPPHDLIERPEMFERNENALADLLALTKRQSCALAVGHIAKSAREWGRPAENVVTILEDGKRVFRQAKTLLPTYDVFDEARYFEPAEETRLWSCDGKKFALAICEDLWGADRHTGRKLYGKDPAKAYRELGSDFVLAIAASPYEWGKRAHREALHAEVAKTVGAPLVYVNQVGATDEILFDGGSFAIDADGKLVGRLPIFKNAFGLFDLEKLQWESPSPENREDEAPQDIEVLYRALVCGIRDYFQRTGFKSALLGLSGGIDSAVVATLAVHALGPKNVRGIAMPSQFSSPHSLEDAEALARNLGIAFEVRPIKFQFSTLHRELAEGRGELHPIAVENLQSRLRGLVLMTLSNHYSSLVLTTGNKSELAMGYCTLYGDMAGALAPIGDLMKTRVYELARYLNLGFGSQIPERSITKPPSAELRPNQTDQDTLPPYEELDPLLAEYIEKGTPVAVLEKKFAKTGEKNSWVREILRRLEVNEYKRRQAAPVLKISSRAFGMGRRIPIAKVWE